MLSAWLPPCAVCLEQIDLDQVFDDGVAQIPDIHVQKQASRRVNAEATMITPAAELGKSEINFSKKEGRSQRRRQNFINCSGHFSARSYGGHQRPDQGAKGGVSSVRGVSVPNVPAVQSACGTAYVKKSTRWDTKDLVLASNFDRWEVGTGRETARCGRSDSDKDDPFLLSPSPCSAPLLPFQNSVPACRAFKAGSHKLRRGQSDVHRAEPSGKICESLKEPSCGRNAALPQRRGSSQDQVGTEARTALRAGVEHSLAVVPLPPAVRGKVGVVCVTAGVLAAKNFRCIPVLANVGVSTTPVNHNTATTELTPRKTSAKNKGQGDEVPSHFGYSRRQHVLGTGGGLSSGWNTRCVCKEVLHPGRLVAPEGKAGQRKKKKQLCVEGGTEGVLYAPSRVLSESATHGAVNAGSCRDVVVWTPPVAAGDDLPMQGVCYSVARPFVPTERNNEDSGPGASVERVTVLTVPRRKRAGEVYVVGTQFEANCPSVALSLQRPTQLRKQQQPVLLLGNGGGTSDAFRPPAGTCNVGVVYHATSARMYSVSLAMSPGNNFVRVGSENAISIYCLEGVVQSTMEHRVGVHAIAGTRKEGGGRSGAAFISGIATGLCRRPCATIGVMPIEQRQLLSSRQTPKRSHCLKVILKSKLVEDGALVNPVCLIEDTERCGTGPKVALPAETEPFVPAPTSSAHNAGIANQQQETALVVCVEGSRRSIADPHQPTGEEGRLALEAQGRSAAQTSAENASATELKPVIPPPNVLPPTTSEGWASRAKTQWPPHNPLGNPRLHSQLSTPLQLAVAGDAMVHDLESDTKTPNAELVRSVKEIPDESSPSSPFFPTPSPPLPSSIPLGRLRNVVAPFVVAVASMEPTSKEHVFSHSSSSDDGPLYSPPLLASKRRQQQRKQRQRLVAAGQAGIEREDERKRSPPINA